ncbi:MAG: SDR family oxidoreductase [Chitinispirillaceae bacterium]|nr:SDR family oxidoreductase [Chitinispirillaceae bacterium]
MKKLLITGASGFLGWNCCRIATKNYMVTGLYNSHNCSVPGVDYIQCNITDTKKLDQIISGIGPSIIIHTAAISAPNQCQKEPVASRGINVDVSGALARICHQRDVKFVFTSSDQVFSGEEAPYSENSPVSPVNIYGKQKADAEQLIMQECPDAAVCRMPLMYGDAPEGATSFIIPWLEMVRNGTALKLFIDEMRTPVSARDAACGLLLAAEKVSGVIHLGGREVLSRYEMGMKLAEAAGLDNGCIQACKQSGVKMSAPRPLNVSMDSSKAFSIGFSPGMFSDELKGLQNISR